MLKEGALLVVVGLLIGAPGCNIANRLIRDLLIGVSSISKRCDKTRATPFSLTF